MFGKLDAKHAEMDLAFPENSALRWARRGVEFGISGIILLSSGLIYLDPLWGWLVFILILSVGGYALFLHLLTGRTVVPRKLAVMILEPSDEAWEAALERGFLLEYPRWKEFVATGKYNSTKFEALRQILWRQWLEQKPDFPHRLEKDAFWKALAAKFGSDTGHRMHAYYRNWEVAQDTRCIRAMSHPA